MRSVGIICECNPLHEGHLRLIREARRDGAEAVICVMSGCFTQRGEAAIAEPFSRAEALLEGGADAVLELPFPYSSSGAEFFASAGVNILGRLGAGELWFGSESGDLDLLWRMAEETSSADFLAAYAEKTRSAEGTAQTYFSLLAERMGLSESALPNDILGISYLRAIRAQGDRMTPHVILRSGSAFRDTVLQSGVIPSASALRKGFLEEGLDAILPHLPEVTARTLREAEEKASAPADLSRAEAFILGKFRMAEGDAFEEIAELSGGLGRRLAELSFRAESLDALLLEGATKKYPQARLRRGILFALAGVTAADLRREPSYVRLLGANATGRAFLAEARRRGEISVLTRRSDRPRTDAAERQELLEKRALSLYALCLPKPTDPASLLRRPPIMK